MVQKKSQRKSRNVIKKSSARSRKSLVKRRSVKKSSTRSRKSVIKRRSVKKSSTRSRKSVVKSKSVVTRKEEVKKKIIDRSSKVGDVIFGKNGIDSLSGPVSFYYLRPTKKVYKDGNGHYFPLIVLFGDVHFSLENICKPWISKRYELSNPYFLKKLDRLSEPDHPIDFYTETVLSGTGRAFDGGPMKDLTTREMISCYHHRLRGTRHDKCPTKHIRWHASETRIIWNYGYYYENDYFMKKLYKNPSNISKMEKKIWIEQQFSMLLRYFSFLTKDQPKDRRRICIRIIKSLAGGVFKNIESLQRLLLTLCDDSNGTKYINLDKFAETFFGLFTKKNSLIYKQIAKQSYLPFRYFQTWIEFYKRSLDKALLINIEKEKLQETIGKLPFVLSDPDFHFNDKDIENLTAFGDINAPLLDIYTIARIWKHPTGGIRSSLSFGYFGNYHVENIVQLLLSTNAYELVYEKKKTEDVSRCQTFDVTLNLSKEVRMHNQKIE